MTNRQIAKFVIRPVPALSPIRPLLKGWLLSFLVFGLLATGLVGQFALAVSMPWSDALRMAARDWLPWALVAPLIFRLVARMPLERERWKPALVVHLASCVAILALCQWWSESVLPRPSGRGGPRTENRESRPPRMAAPEGMPPRGPERSQRHNPFPFFFLIGFRLPVYFAIVSVAHAVHFYRRSQVRERRSLELEASLARARLEALKMQLQPHFLFNSLNAIAELVHKDADAADEMLGALSDFLRLTLESAGEQELPLRRELEFVERYLAIEKVRFGERLHFSIEVPPEALPALVPALVLQPLVENAVPTGPSRRAGAERPPRPLAGSPSVSCA